MEVSGAGSLEIVTFEHLRLHKYYRIACPFTVMLPKPATGSGRAISASSCLNEHWAEKGRDGISWPPAECLLWGIIIMELQQVLTWQGGRDA